jgi:DNA-binding MarR family transcriptional regulator
MPKKASAPFDSDPFVHALGPRRLPIVLRRAWYGLNQTFRRRIAHLEITPDQFTALRTIAEAGEEGLAQSELTRLMASDPNTIASLLTRMQRNGLIGRRIHEKDRRAYRIRVLAKGQERFEEARKIALELQSEVLGILPAETRDGFLEQLASVADACHRLARELPKSAS